MLFFYSKKPVLVLITRYCIELFTTYNKSAADNFSNTFFQYFTWHSLEHCLPMFRLYRWMCGSNNCRNTSKEDVSKISSNLKEVLGNSDKAADPLTSLRQLFFILQANTELTERKEVIPVNQLLSLIDAKDKIKFKDSLLALRLIQELLPLDLTEAITLKSVEQLAPCYFHLQVTQCNTDECLGNLCSKALRSIQSSESEWETQRKSLTFLTSVCSEHGKFVWKGQYTPVYDDLVQTTNDKLGFWLKDVGLYQAPNPYTSNPFRKDQNNLVTEVDGTPSTNFFTVLNIGQHYTPDQQMNITGFSILYQWLYHSHEALKSQPQLETNDNQHTDSFKLLSGTVKSLSVSPGKPLARRSPSSPTMPNAPHVRLSPQRASSLSSKPLTPNRLTLDRATTPVDILKGSIAEGTYGKLIRNTMDYCLRILDQCDRKTKMSSDADLQNACLMESVKLIDLVCKIDNSQVSKAFMELKRLCTQISVDLSTQSQRLYLHIVQFLLNHCSAVAYDPHEELNTLFHRILSRNFNSHAVGFDIIMFILDNLGYLCHQCNIMSTFFPNILKLIAWNPHTFLYEFVEILPAVMSEGTSLEVFHSILDLPCMTIALEVTEKMKNVDLTTLNMMSSQQEPTNTVDAFKNAMYRPMFNFYTRAEGGHGDTINRLDRFHAALVDMMEHPRVLVCYQTAPVLLRVWFNVMLEEGTEDLVSELVPVLLERTSMVYGIPEYQKDIKRIITDNTALLFKKFPQVVLGHRSDITDFLSNIRNISGWEDFFCLMVFGVGEYISTVYGHCTADNVQHVYEALEVLTYEVISVTANTPEKEAPYTIKVVSALISALSKLATRCQDLIPRAILCLTKVINQHHNSSSLEKEKRDILTSRAQELLNVLRIPNFASVVLNPSQYLEAIQVHCDRTSLTSVIRTTHNILSDTP